MRPLPAHRPEYRFSASLAAAATVAAIGTLLLGIYPTAVLAVAHSAILGLAR